MCEVHINADKTKLLYFRRNCRFTPFAQNVCMSIQIYDSTIRVSRSAKLLGVTFDHCATFKEHVCNIVNKCRSKLNFLRCLGGIGWGCSGYTIMRFYTGFVRPSIEHGSIAWIGMADCHHNSLQRVQNQALRLACRVPRYTPTAWIHDLTDLPTIKERIEFLNMKYLTHVVRDDLRLPMSTLQRSIASPCPRRLRIQTNLQALHLE